MHNHIGKYKLVEHFTILSILLTMLNNCDDQSRFIHIYMKEAIEYKNMAII